MIIIHARINDKFDDIPFDENQINELCISLGLKSPLNINTTEELQNLMEIHKEDKILLFTNFPADNTYTDIVVQGKLSEVFYSRTLSFFHNLTRRYHFVAVHIITGALHQVLQNEQIYRHMKVKNITITRADKWLVKSEDFAKLYTDFLKDKIKNHVSR